VLLLATTTDLTKGVLWKQNLFFAIPLAASSILQQLFNSADVAVVGQFAGSQALAAVGANGVLINLFVNSFVGLSVGANAGISTYIGEERAERIHTAVHTSIAIAVILGVGLMCFVLAGSHAMLSMLSTPDNIMNQALIYLRIYAIGVPFILLYNFEAAILRSNGNTRRPLISLSIAGVVNVILNLFFVIVLKMGVAGVAIATVASNIISSIDLFSYLVRSDSIVKVTIGDIGIDRHVLKRIAYIGVPASLQGAVFSISNVILQKSLNSFGDIAIAGTTDALNFEYVSFYIITAFGSAAVTFVGQCYGAKDFKRCKDVSFWCLLEGLSITVVASALMCVFAPQLASIFSNDPKVIHIAVIRMYWLIGFEIFNGAIEIFSGIMRGYGFSGVPAFITVFGVCGVRLFWNYIILPLRHTYSTLVLCYPLSWIITTMGLLIAYVYLMRRMKQMS